MGWSWLAGHATLIHERDDLHQKQDLVLRRRMTRTTGRQGDRTFYCYRSAREGTTRDPDASDHFPDPGQSQDDDHPTRPVQDRALSLG